MKRLEEAENKLRDWQRAASTAERDSVLPPHPGVVAELLDDLNFHKVSVVLDGLSRDARKGDETAADLLGASLEFLGFGVDSLLQPASLSVDATVDIEEAVAARLAALNAKDFAKADSIRAQLLTQGVQLMDYKDEAGQRQTKWELKP